jgi:hypothetical protein
MYMTPEDWLEIVRKEYLQDFIRGGGAVVKFVVPAEGIDHIDLREKIRSISESEGYLFACVDAAKTRIHMIDHLFHSVARQVDWDDLAFSFMYRILSESGYNIPPHRQEVSLQKIAELSGRDQGLLQGELNFLLERNLFRDYKMCQEFRIAMIRLCQAQLDPGGLSPVPSVKIKEWLRGELRLISEIKRALIFQKVKRYNARPAILGEPFGRADNKVE